MNNSSETPSEISSWDALKSIGGLVLMYCSAMLLLALSFQNF
ncbi:hypothetical protein [Acinetobacter sp. YH12227]|nr:hypothetical protein [Acinetobacter sp. YH12227]